VGYTAVRGGLDAIQNAEALVAAMPHCSDNPIDVRQVEAHLAIAVDRVMSEGGLIDPGLAAIAIKQAEGDLIEAAFLIRAYRSTLPRLGYSLPTDGSRMVVLRRISSIFRDIPGGQVLGLTRDYTQRLLDFDLLRSAAGHPPGQPPREVADPPAFPGVIGFLRNEGLLAPAPPEPSEDEPFDVTRMPLRFPAPRSAALQVLARGEAGAMLMLAYSSMRGYGGVGHGALGELRYGELSVRISHPITGRPVAIGHVRATEVHYLSGGHGSLQEGEAEEYYLGYGLVAGRDERKAISMAILDASLRYARPDDTQPVAQQEFVLTHVDSIESSGFVEHLKLPHYVTFQAGLQRSRKFKEMMGAAANG